jgi:HEAT repeat protein
MNAPLLSHQVGHLKQCLFKTLFLMGSLLLLTGCGKDDDLAVTSTENNKTSLQPGRSVSTPQHMDLKESVNQPDIDEATRLAQDGSIAAAHALLARIEQLPDGELKEQTVSIACTMKNRACLPTLIRTLETSRDAGVLRAASQILQVTADSNSLQQVLDAFDASTDATFRRTLEGVVANVRTEEAVPTLTQILSDSTQPVSDGMVSASARALREIGTASAVDAVIERINSDTSPESRALLRAEISQVKNPQAEMALQSAASGTSKFADTPDARTSAIRALVHYPSSETRDLLMKLTHDADAGVREAAIETHETLINYSGSNP